MNSTALYRTEALRLVRTHALLGLTAFFAVFGAGAAVLTYYMPDIMRAIERAEDLGPGMLGILPDVTPEQAIAGYVDNAQQLGTLMVVLVAAAALAVDGSPGRSTFYRVRVSGPADLVLPRFVLSAAAAVFAYTVGTVTTWAVAGPVLGPLPWEDVLLGALFGGLFLVFAVAVVALVASVAHGLLPTLGFALLGLVLVAAVGMVPWVGDWSPSALFAAQVGIVMGEPVSDHLPAVVSGVVGTIALVALAIRRFGAREI